LAKPLPLVPPLYPDGDPTQAADPDVSLLDSEEAAMFASLTDPERSFKNIRKATQDRVRAIRSTLEFRIDHLASNIHTLDQRVTTGSREADKVLAFSADRLKERETMEKTASGTKDLPTMEVLRSLSRLLPEEGG
jgi:kinetochore protein Mis13/DSN1